MRTFYRNPFEVLRLDPGTPTEEIVRAAGRLRQRAADEAAVAAIRQAVQALTGTDAERCLHALRTHPAPRYDWPAVEQFMAAFRRRPMPVEGPPNALSQEVCSPATAPASSEQFDEALWQSLILDPRG
jgi:hypothetical protein